MAKIQFETQDIRNVALVGHGACGKTALGEAMLFDAGATTRLGSTTGGTSTFDFEPEEIKRGGSNATAFAWIEHQGKKINIIDTPGDGNFVYDSIVAIRGADAALVVVSAPDGVEVQTERGYQEAAALGIPRMVVINKMDRERANPDMCIKEFEENLGVRVVPVEIPIGNADTFVGVVPLLTRKAMRYNLDSSGKYKTEELPANLAPAFAAAMEKLVEAVAESDDALLEKYLETMELSEEEVRNGLCSAIKAGKLIPAVYVSASANIGIHALLDLIGWAFPNPLERAPFDAVQADGELAPIKIGSDQPFAALVVRSFIDDYSGKLNVFRVFSGIGPADGAVVNQRTGETERLGAVYALRGSNRDAVERAVCGDILAVAKLKDTRTSDSLTQSDSKLRFPPMVYPPPMMEYTLTVENKGDEDKLKSAVEKLIDEDPTVTIGYDELGRQLVLRGMGQQHLDMAVEKMKRKFKVEVLTALPLVPYRETLRKRVANVEGKHKKQTGGAGQFGVCYLNAEPLARGEGFKFVDKIVGGSIPRTFIPSVEKGVMARMGSGPLAGYPVTDLAVELIDGKYHPVDSKDIAFQAAGSKGIRSALEQGGCKLLEPIYKLDIIVPTESMGSIMGDITSRRGRVLGMEPVGSKKTMIHALCPMAEIQRYAPDLRSMTGGQGIFSMQLEGYEDVPGNLEAKIIKESPFRGAVEEDD